MKNFNSELNETIAKCLNDIQVQLSSEFDLNFERKAFFTKAWERKRPNSFRSDNPLLVDTLRLRKSIQGKVEGNKLTFSTDVHYARIHNEGGIIRVTSKMKGYFWIKYKEAIGGFAFTKKGEMRKTEKNRQIRTEAEFYKAMALMKLGSKIRIPKRQFVGNAPEVEKIIREIAYKSFHKFADSIVIKIK